MTKLNIYPTSPVLDLLLCTLSQLLEDCDSAYPGGCEACPVFKKCTRWWSGISSNGTVKMTKPRFLLQESRFLEIKSRRDNGHRYD